MRIGHVASERTILLTNLDPTRLDGGKERENRERKERGKREKRKRKERGEILEREALPSLKIF